MTLCKTLAPHSKRTKVARLAAVLVSGLFVGLSPAGNALALTVPVDPVTSDEVTVSEQCGLYDTLYVETFTANGDIVSTVSSVQGAQTLKTTLTPLNGLRPSTIYLREYCAGGGVVAGPTSQYTCYVIEFAPTVGFTRFDPIDIQSKLQCDNILPETGLKSTLLELFVASLLVVTGTVMVLVRRPKTRPVSGLTGL